MRVLTRHGTHAHLTTRCSAQARESSRVTAPALSAGAQVAEGDPAVNELRPQGLVHGRRIPDIVPAAAASIPMDEASTAVPPAAPPESTGMSPWAQHEFEV